ncbi:unnamed protein product [Mytilus edulis]|uniref:Uncharacterized protein n=1 Tax=Mytilus edulis TaxID=6550 RepID=A0A8S3S9S4_MYTED|nr:unnamed protein product [Mytilus edulis]
MPIKLYWECEHINRKVRVNQDKIELRVPYVYLNNICLKIRDESFLSVVSTSKYSNDIILKGDLLRLEAYIVHTLFKTTIDKSKALMEDVFTKYRYSHNVEAIVMVSVAKAKQGSKGKLLTSSQPDDKDPCKEKILVKLKGYLQTLTPRNWEDLAVKTNYVKGTAAKRAVDALDSAVEDAHVLISVVKTHVPNHMKTSNHCLVELLFTIIAIG